MINNQKTTSEEIEAAFCRIVQIIKVSKKNIPLKRNNVKVTMRKSPVKIAHCEIGACTV